MYSNDPRIVMTLDAGGTNLVFSAIQSNRDIVEPISIPTVPDNLEACLLTLKEGFDQVKRALGKQNPVAISFAFPGPADYKNGVIGDLPNFPAFRGGVALAAYLQNEFQIPVYINNDGSLYAYGEALAGLLPEVNRRLAEAGSSRRYNSLLGITFGTGFGGGVVIDGRLHRGDNDSGGYVWMLRNKKYPDLIVEESVSIRAIKRVYGELAGVDASCLSPKEIFEIAEGVRSGNAEAAKASFAELGEIAGDAIVKGVAMVDGLVAIGGGLTGAAKYILPALLKEMRGTLATFAGDRFRCIESSVYNLNDPSEIQAFVNQKSTQVSVPFSDQKVDYQTSKSIGVAFTSLGASRAISLGAYAYALSELDR